MQKISTSSVPLRLFFGIVLLALALPSAYAADLTLPRPGSTLISSVDQFRWNPVDGAEKYRIWVGTSEDADAYGRFAVAEGAHGLDIGNLPIDGSEVVVTVKWYDGARWHTEAPVAYTASTQAIIAYPIPGSTLSGNSSYFKLSRHLSDARIKIGSASNPVAHAVLRPDRTQYVLDLPVDGSEIWVTVSWHDGLRWRHEKPISYQAASGESLGIWGDCTQVGNWGRTPKLSNGYSGITGRLNERATRGGFSSTRTTANQILRDGCASDSEYLALSELYIHTSQYEKGLFLWLAADSGPAAVRVEALSHAQRPWSSAGGYIRVVQPDASVAKPIFLHLTPDEAMSITVLPLDDERPVKVSEIRMARLNEDVTQLRKSRFSTHGLAFAASNGDARARVSAEIAESFAEQYFVTEGWKSGANCGSYTWVDATWEIDEGVVVKDGVAWVNFNLATNAEIHAAIRGSMESPNWYCTPASDDLVEQDWVGKAAAALDGSYAGPVLYTE